MSALTWFLRGTLFIVLLGLAIKNSSDVELRFFFDANWQAPLSLIVLACVAAGVFLGMLVLLPQIFRQRRRIAELQRLLDKRPARPVEALSPVAVDS